MNFPSNKQNPTSKTGFTGSFQTNPTPQQQAKEPVQEQQSAAGLEVMRNSLEAERSRAERPDWKGFESLAPDAMRMQHQQQQMVMPGYGMFGQQGIVQRSYDRGGFRGQGEFQPSQGMGRIGSGYNPTNLFGGGSAQELQAATDPDLLSMFMLDQLEGRRPINGIFPSPVSFIATYSDMVAQVSESVKGNCGIDINVPKAIKLISTDKAEKFRGQGLINTNRGRMLQHIACSGQLPGDIAHYLSTIATLCQMYYVNNDEIIIYLPFADTVEPYRELFRKLQLVMAFRPLETAVQCAVTLAKMHKSIKAITDSDPFNIEVMMLTADDKEPPSGYLPLTSEKIDSVFGANACAWFDINTYLAYNKEKKTFLFFFHSAEVAGADSAVIE